MQNMCQNGKFKDLIFHRDNAPTANAVGDSFSLLSRGKDSQYWNGKANVEKMQIHFFLQSLLLMLTQ